MFKKISRKRKLINGLFTLFRYNFNVFLLASISYKTF